MYLTHVCSPLVGDTS